MTPETPAHRDELLRRLLAERYGRLVRSDRPLPHAGPRVPVDDGELAVRRRRRELLLDEQLAAQSGPAPYRAAT